MGQLEQVEVDRKTPKRKEPASGIRVRGEDVVSFAFELSAHPSLYKHRAIYKGQGKSYLKKLVRDISSCPQQQREFQITAHQVSGS